MKNVFLKGSIKEILKTLPRWLAILSIIALGVGFFSGLKVCKASFWHTGDVFFTNSNFYDFRLISTLGLDEDSLKTIKETDGITYCEGSHFTDALISINNTDLKALSSPALSDSNEKTSSSGKNSNSEFVVNIHSITKKINKLDLVEGSLPNNPEECVVDNDRFKPADIGKYLYISKGNNDDTLNMLKFKKFKIVGLAESPLYLNFERGTTSLGDGHVEAFVYLPDEAFKGDVYTEIYVSKPNMGKIFSKEYKDNIKKIKPDVKKSLIKASNERYEKIKGEGQEEIDKNLNKLRQKKSDFNKAKDELTLGKKKLNEAKSNLKAKENDVKNAELKINRGRKTLNSSKGKLDVALKKFDEARLELKNQEALAYQKLKPLEDALALGESNPKYKEILAQYESAKAEIDKEFSEPKKKLEEEKTKLDSASKELKNKEAQLKAKEEELSKGKLKIKEAKSQIISKELDLIESEKELKKAEKKLKSAQDKLNRAQDKLDKIEHPDNFVLDRTTNIGYVCFENDTSIVNGIAKIFPLFFILVAALVVMTTMTRMMEEQRTQVGVLKALGYSKLRILNRYLLYSGSASLIGGVLGFYIGINLFPLSIWEAYGIMYHFSPLILSVSPWIGTLSILSGVLCATGTTFYSCYNDLKEVPAQLIRPKAPSMGKRILLENMPFIWNKLSFLHKVTARNIFRYKKRFFMMILGVSGCTALLLTGLGIDDSIKNVVSEQYDKIFHPDYVVTFDKAMTPVDEEEFLERNKEVIDKAIFTRIVSLDAKIHGKTKAVNMVVFKNGEDINQFIDIHDKKNKPIPLASKGKCVVNENLAKRLKLKIGDSITLTDSDMNSITCKIENLCENYVYNYMYITQETYEAQLGKLNLNTALIIRKDVNSKAHDDSRDGAFIMKSRHVSALSITKDFRERISKMMDGLDYVVALVVMCAGFLAFIVLYNLTNINITERIREIATIKVLGFNTKESLAYVFREVIMLTVISTIVGLPSGMLLHRFVMSQIIIDLISFDIHITPLSYAIAIGLTLLFSSIVSLFMIFKIQKISMIESLKSIE